MMFVPWETRPAPPRLLQSRVTKDGAHLNLEVYCVIRTVFPKGVSYRGKLQSFMNWKWCICSTLIIVPLLNYIRHLSRKKSKSVKESGKGGKEVREKGRKMENNVALGWNLIWRRFGKQRQERVTLLQGVSKVHNDQGTENPAKNSQDTKFVCVHLGMFINKFHFDSS